MFPTFFEQVCVCVCVCVCCFSFLSVKKGREAKYFQDLYSCLEFPKVIFFFPNFEFDHKWMASIDYIIDQSAGAVEYTECTSEEDNTPHPTNDCRGYNIKQSDGEVPLILELWGMRSTASLTSLPGTPAVLVPYRVLSMDQIELNCILMLNWIVWNRTVFDV